MKEDDLRAKLAEVFKPLIGRQYTPELRLEIANRIRGVLPKPQLGCDACDGGILTDKTTTEGDELTVFFCEPCLVRVLGDSRT